VSIKTAKFTIDKFVPIVGSLFAQSVDVVITCTLLIKNAVGIAGIIIIAAIVISPAFTILAHYFLFKLTGAVLEPIAEGGMSKFVQDAADVLMILFVAVIAAAIMFFVTTAVIIGAGNANIMLR
jgi:stage III sporulation protein AE